jgi:hypothetical protein
MKLMGEKQKIAQSLPQLASRRKKREVYVRLILAKKQ